MAKLIHKKVSGSTLIEVLIAMVIIMVVFPLPFPSLVMC